mmetsp:Transcript_15475/g.33470  ORF Transcript_15475/g.33470 Transcript_15475/m.33470 type:complete len:383 (+) Transcript_15475:1185-2333(+)
MRRAARGRQAAALHGGTPQGGAGGGICDRAAGGGQPHPVLHPRVRAADRVLLRGHGGLQLAVRVRPGHSLRRAAALQPRHPRVQAHARGAASTQARRVPLLGVHHDGAADGGQRGWACEQPPVDQGRCDQQQDDAHSRIPPRAYPRPGRQRHRAGGPRLRVARAGGDKDRGRAQVLVHRGDRAHPGGDPHPGEHQAQAHHQHARGALPPRQVLLCHGVRGGRVHDQPPHARPPPRGARPRAALRDVPGPGVLPPPQRGPPRPQEREPAAGQGWAREGGGLRPLHYPQPRRPGHVADLRHAGVRGAGDLSTAAVHRRGGCVELGGHPVRAHHRRGAVPPAHLRRPQARRRQRRVPRAGVPVGSPTGSAAAHADCGPCEARHPG